MGGGRGKKKTGNLLESLADTLAATASVDGDLYSLSYTSLLKYDCIISVAVDSVDCVIHLSSSMRQFHVLCTGW